jgi:hypothetical protein
LAQTGERFVRAVYHLRKDQKRRLAQQALNEDTPGGASGLLRQVIDQVFPPPNPGSEQEREGERA